MKTVFALHALVVVRFALAAPAPTHPLINPGCQDDGSAQDETAAAPWTKL